MAFIGNITTKPKIVIQNLRLEKISHFNYLGSKMCYKYAKTSIKNYWNIKKITEKKSALLNMTMPKLTYANETCIVANKHTQKIVSSKMKILRRVKGVKMLKKSKKVR